MSDQPAVSTSAAPAKGELNLPLFLALMANTVAVNLVVSLVRVTTSYRAIELDVSVLWISIIAAGFSLVPIFAAVQLGRFIDRGHDALSAWIGAFLMLAACAGIWSFGTSEVNLLAFSILLGFGHMFCMAAHQMISVRCGTGMMREHVFGYHMIAIATGQGLGPMLLGWLGGGAHIPPTQLLFTCAFAFAAISQMLSFLLRPVPAGPEKRAAGSTVTIRELLGKRALIAVLISSVVTITAFELLVVYLPLLGTERQIDTRDIGLLLATRSAVSIVSRLFYTRLLVLVGRMRLMLHCMLLGAVAFAIVGLPVNLPLMYFAIVLMGFGLGLATTLTFSEVVHLAPDNGRAVALSLRVTGNRIGQMVVPVLAGVVAEATGIGGVLIIIAGFLAASGVYANAVLKRP